MRPRPRCFVPGWPRAARQPNRRSLAHREHHRPVAPSAESSRATARPLSPLVRLSPPNGSRHISGGVPLLGRALVVHGSILTSRHGGSGDPRPFTARERSDRHRQRHVVGAFQVRGVLPAPYARLGLGPKHRGASCSLEPPNGVHPAWAACQTSGRALPSSSRLNLQRLPRQVLVRGDRRVEADDAA